MWTTLAAISPEDTRWILISCAVLLLLIIVGGLGVWYYRKQVLFSDSSSQAAVWTFDDLRRMRDRGELTEQEYQSLRAAMIGSYKSKPNQDRPDAGAAGSGPPTTD